MFVFSPGTAGLLQPCKKNLFQFRPLTARSRQEVLHLLFFSLFSYIWYTATCMDRHCWALYYSSTVRHPLQHQQLYSAPIPPAFLSRTLLLRFVYLWLWCIYWNVSFSFWLVRDPLRVLYLTLSPRVALSHIRRRERKRGCGRRTSPPFHPQNGHSIFSE